jgi:hypothetical protein
LIIRHVDPTDGALPNTTANHKVLQPEMNTAINCCEYVFSKQPLKYTEGVTSAQTQTSTKVQYSDTGQLYHIYFLH